MGKFIAGFVISTLIFLAFAFTYAIQESNFIQATCIAGDDLHKLYIQDDDDRALVCKYLNRDVGLDQ